MEWWIRTVMEPLTIGMLLFAGGLTLWKRSCFRVRKKQKQKGIYGFGAAMTALSGTIGTGNMIGVAVALSVGGPGSIFWMCVAAVIGMSVKYAEIVLACKERICLPSGNIGGPMYYLERYYGRTAGITFAVLCLLTGCGVGNLAQSGAVGRMLRTFQMNPTPRRWMILLMAALFALCLYFGMNGGTKRVQNIASILTPCMAVGYLMGCIMVLVYHADRIPAAAAAIVRGAFGSSSIFGAAMGTAIKTGVMRGLFTNESGLGSAPIAHACSNEDPHTAGIWGIFEVFMDTVVMCSVTGLTLLVSDVSALDGYTMTAAAFENAFGLGGRVFLSAALWLFALAAAIGWGFYGSRSLAYLTGKGQKLYPILFSLLSFIGFFLPQNGVLLYADLTNSTMLLYHAGMLCFILLADGSP